jgi:hypothetical protein
MIIRLSVFLISLALTLSAVAAATDMRTWTDTRGRQIYARAISLTDNDVVFEKEDSTTITISILDLREADRDYVQQHFEEKEEEKEPGRSVGPMPIILLVLGIIVSTIGGIWFLVVAFKESVLWGLGCMFVPFVSLIFLISHWSDTAKPFGVSLLGSVIMVVAVMIAPQAGP